VAAFLFVSVGSAFAAPTKEECLDAHSRGQDQQEAGHLSLARDSFSVCSQPSCPALVQSDCAEFSEQLARLSPSVSFAARDQLANDLPDTQVYVDGALVAQSLGDGRSYDIDPGTHAVRFVHGERTVLLNVVITQGEHGRSLVANFVGPGQTAGAGVSVATVLDMQPRMLAKGSKRAVLPLIVAAGGGAALVTGAVLMGVGFGKVPNNCSLGSHECSAPPGAAAFNDAHSGVSLANAGLGTAIAGAVIGTVGLIWYFAESPTAVPRMDAGVHFDGTGFSF